MMRTSKEIRRLANAHAADALKGCLDCGWENLSQYDEQDEQGEDIVADSERVRAAIRAIIKRLDKAGA